MMKKLLLLVALCMGGISGAWYCAQAMLALPAGSPSFCLTGGTQPAPAAAAGYNCLKIYETWPSLSVVDTTDSRAAGFHWYTHNGSTQTPPGTANAGGWSFGTILPTPNTDYSWSTPGQISLAPVSGTPYAGLPVMFMSCAQQGTSKNLVGTVFGPGAYIDVEFIQFGSFVDAQTWNIAWGVPTTMLIGGVGTSWQVFEPDILEDFTNPPGSGFTFAYHDWSGTGSTVTFNNSFGTPFITTNAGDTYGVLMLPAIYNSGTNKVQRYVNDVLVSSSVCTSTGSSTATCNGGASSITLADINTNQYCLALAAGAGGTPNIFGKIQVWTKN